MHAIFRVFSLWLGLMLAFTTHAGALEDLLANPAIQSLLARQGDLRNALARCSDPRIRQQNQQLCLQADDANRLARMPIELRAILSNPVAADSLRELCMAVQGMQTQNTFLCTRLFEADPAFAQQAMNLRYQRNEATRDRP